MAYKTTEITLKLTTDQKELMSFISNSLKKNNFLSSVGRAMRDKMNAIKLQPK